MKSLFLVLCSAALSLCPISLAQNPPSQQSMPPKSDAQVSFDAVKALAGTWSGRVTTDPHNPDIEGPIQVTMRVASGGSLVVHEMSPNGMLEPTMIYVEGDHLTLVHYCEAGNRPRLAARKSPDQKKLEFDFVDISGSTSPAYVHNFVLTMINPDHHTEDWTFMLPGDNQLHAHFDLTRAKDAAPTPPSK
jgi:hypothetical protein